MPRIVSDALNQFQEAVGKEWVFTSDEDVALYRDADSITHDVAINIMNRETFKQVVRVAAEHGWGEYRTAPAFQDAVMDTYSFNNHALRRFHETIKSAFGSDDANIQKGEKVFDYWCATCHGPGLPGTVALQAK
jgi:mono/diheme cytochrome c family protein